MSYTKSKDLIDPQSFGNWILVDERTITGAVVDYTISNIDGDVDPRWMFEVELSNGPSASGIGIRLRPNGDNTSSYVVSRQYGGVAGQHNADQSLTGTNGLYLMSTDGGNAKGFSTTIFNSRTSGDLTRRALTQESSRLNSTYEYVMNSTSVWPNTSTKITSMQITSGGYVIVGSVRIKIYKWTDFKPVQLHSYELVKEYNLAAQALNGSISWDGDVDDSIYIETNTLASANAATVLMQFNNDTVVDNYIRGYITQDGAVVSSASGSPTAGFSVGYSAVNESAYYRSFINLKSGVYRKMQATMSRYISDNTDLNLYLQSAIWKNSVDKVTSITFTSQSVAVTGIIRVYKLAKTHLICQEPGLLRGVWFKSIDNDTIQVQPGSIEIGGVTHNQGSSINITLSGNLRSGGSKAPSTYYYLYANKSSSRTPVYNFTSVAPSKDRYGNTLALVDAEPEQDLYHPSDPNARYIGQVYNNSSNNIVQFSKCKPGYWEGVWTATPGNTNSNISHSFGKIPNTGYLTFKYNLNDTGIYNSNVYIESGGSSYGTWQCNGGYHTNIIFKCYFGLYPFRDDTSWRTSGYYKLIIRS